MATFIVNGLRGKKPTLFNTAGAGVNWYKLFLQGILTECIKSLKLHTPLGSDIPLPKIYPKVVTELGQRFSHYYSDYNTIYNSETKFIRVK